MISAPTPTLWLCPTDATAGGLGWLEATVYDSVVEHEHVAGVLGRFIWGTDTSAFYREIARLAAAPEGTVILDVPCGGGRVPRPATRTARALCGRRSLAGDAAARPR
jgi:hypothetical protein